MADYAQHYSELRQRRGVTLKQAQVDLLDLTRFGCLMLHNGEADALIAGLTQHYPETIRPALQVIPVHAGLRRVSGLYMLITPGGHSYFLADTTVNIEPSAEDLAEIALEAAEMARRFDQTPRVAMLSFFEFRQHPASAG